MSDLARCSTWTLELCQAFPHLSKPQAKQLAEFSQGMVLAEGSGLSRVAWTLAQLRGESYEAVRERLRDFYRSAEAKPGAKRREVDVRECFGPLLAWLLRDWEGRQLPIALDATHLGERFVVLAISVVYRACAIPVAWKILSAHHKGSWRPYWLELLEQFASLVPPSMQVIAMADRGLYAKWLYEAVVGLGWRPLFRINQNDNVFRPEGGAYQPLSQLLPAPGQDFAARGTMFRSPSTQLRCTLLGRWDCSYDEPCWVLTDIDPSHASAAWYDLRFWIERGFYHMQSGGWNWQETRMTDPDRAERQWLVMAVASVLLLRQGGSCDVERRLPRTTASKSRRRPTHKEPAKRSAAAGTRRVLSVFCAGMLLMRITLLTGQPLPKPTLIPEPWPATHTNAPDLTVKPPTV